MPAIDDLKRQIAQLDALIADGVLTGDAARSRRDALEQAVVDAITAGAVVSGAAAPPGAQPAGAAAAAAAAPGRLLAAGATEGAVTAAAVAAAGPPALPIRPAPRRLLAAVVAFALVFGAAGYAWRGNRDGLRVGPGPSAAAGAASAPAADGVQDQAAIDAQVQAMVDRLAERLKTKPDDADGLAMLARSYTALRRFPEALDVYKRLLPLRPRDAQVLVDYADAMAMVNNRTLDGEPEKLVMQAVQLDPLNLKALALAGTVAFNRADYAGAVGYWQKAVDRSEPDGELTRQLQGAMAEARQRGGLPAAAAQLPAAPAAPAQPGPSAQAVQPAQPPGGLQGMQQPTGGPQGTQQPTGGPQGTQQPNAAALPPAAAAISGRITLAAALRGKVAPGDTLFVFARPTGGARMPLAILRSTAGELPLDFTLDDSLAMSPAARLSQASQVIVGARISKSGNPIAQPGDLQGLSTAVAVGSRGVQIEISQLLP